MTHPTHPNTELTDKQRAELEAAIKMANDMETIEGFIKHGRFVGDAVHVGIARLAEAIRLTRPTISGELDDVIKIVNKQAEDDGLWFCAKTAPEAYLQQELRKLHAVCESASRNLITAKRTEGWQDISTAPKTGESILIAAWHGEKVNLWQSVCYGHYYKTQGRFVYDGYSFGHPTGKMTHWMPLPKPPQPTAEDRGV